jgi:uncharacterized membrane protein (UPF0127 family)
MLPMQSQLLAVLAALVMGAACTGAIAQVAALPSQQPQPQVLPTVQLHAGMHNIKAMVAQTPEQRRIGLMFRREMPVNEGMLFVFEQPNVQCFWMKNTLLPLSIAFVSDDGTVLNVDEMKPQTEDSHCSAGPVRFVLEMNTGWFARRGIQAGAKLSGPPFRR